MLKTTAIVSLLLIGSTIWAASMSCDSCGSECASACGTRHFRSCCFNYLRRKRGPEYLQLRSSNAHGKVDNLSKPTFPVIVLETMPVQRMSNILSSDYKSYPIDDIIETRLQEFDV